ncbi:MAG: ankyrin repeat domain-containing protein [Desulfobacteraceae bacterium]|nr:ankyrin repeat domain-containing protein [Desulfobacteraceae bacterium]
MKKKTIISITITLIVLLCAYYGLGTFLLIKSDIHDLIRYSYNRDSGGFPLYPKGIADFYLFKFRGDEDDLESLKAGKGLGYILALSNDDETEKTIRYLQFFIDKGFNINSVDGDGFSVLHKAVYYNKPKSIAFLLSKSANPEVDIDMSVNSARVGVEQIDRLNSLEYAVYLTEERNQDRSTIIAMLSKP